MAVEKEGIIQMASFQDGNNEQINPLIIGEVNGGGESVWYI